MPARPPDDRTIDKLLELANASTADPAARRWIGDALAAAQAIAACEPRPSPAKHNAPLDAIEGATDRLIATLDELRRHPLAHAGFWRFAAFGPVRASGFESAGVTSTLKKIREAARKGRLSTIGRPRNFRKQHILNLALAFCARFSRTRPSSDANNFFPPFAELFFERSTGLSVKGKGHGISRQIRVALQPLPIEMERATLLNETRPK
jgi:hypothetical protein